MKMMSVQLPKQTEADTHIIPLADLHMGDAQSNARLISALLERIKTEEHTYCLLGGDLMNTAIATSVSDSYSEQLTPMEQIERCVATFGPIKHKILAVVGGNHEARVWKTAGIDMTKLFCQQLGIANRYSDSTAFVFVHTGENAQKRKHNYTIYMTHGSGGGRAWGGKINRLVDYSNIVDADIYVCGHTHSPAIVRQKYFRPSRSNDSLVEVDRLFVNTASALEYGGYGDVQGYHPGSNQYPEIVLCNKEKHAYAIL